MLTISLQRKMANQNGPPSFAVRLKELLDDDRKLGSPIRTKKEFSVSVGVTDRTLRNWLNGRSSPTDLKPLLTALFGEQPYADSKSATWANELKEAWSREQSALRGGPVVDGIAPVGAARTGRGENALGHAKTSSDELRSLIESVEFYRTSPRRLGTGETSVKEVATQNNLGDALQNLSARVAGEGGVSSLCEAVEIYRQALDTQSKENAPTEWAQTQNSLGNALQKLGERLTGESSKAVLDEAISAYRSALEVRTKAEVPLEWAATQNNLGNALQTIGERMVGTAVISALDEAVAAYRAALVVRTRREAPLDWAATQNNLGSAFRIIGDRLSGEVGLSALENSITAYRAALEVRNKSEMPTAWAITSCNLATAEWSLAIKTKSIPPLDSAIERLMDAIDILDANKQLHYANIAKMNLAEIRLMRYTLSSKYD